MIIIAIKSMTQSFRKFLKFQGFPHFPKRFSYKIAIIANIWFKAKIFFRRDSVVLLLSEN